MTWERFDQLVDRRIPKARISYPFPYGRLYANHPEKEPCAVIALARFYAG